MAAVLCICALPATADEAQIVESPEARLLTAVEAVCGGGEVHADGEEIAITGATLVDKAPLVLRALVISNQSR